MLQTIEIRFKGNRRGFHSWQDEPPLHKDEPVIVEVERGLDFGRVVSTGATADLKCGGCDGCATGGDTPAPYPRVSRRATETDVGKHEELRREEEVVRREIAGKVVEHGLQMRISDTEWQWDRQRLTVYFTAEQRVDFRALVRQLAARYRTRIELRQIGVRDETARLGGIGRCGREFCCSTWLTKPSPVNLGLAKDQRLSLNPAQISGGCGRLLCCLKYEHEYYLASRRRFPKEGKMISTLRGPERVVAVDIFGERVMLRSDEHGSRTLPLVDLRAEMGRAAAGGNP
ncbi:MAG TPA: regulatory iron-sulfur-containing complex subunit RicT [Gemmatimonadales bacterium]|nr:regulatory iron-sulfur-containing complex subunit RicT [Gemmatimonadales bacterium]